MAEPLAIASCRAPSAERPSRLHHFVAVAVAVNVNDHVNLYTITSSETWY
jgi:hypothetical protein